MEIHLARLCVSARQKAASFVNVHWRWFLSIITGLELALAAALFLLGCCLPSEAEITAVTQHANAGTKIALGQIQTFRRGVSDLRGQELSQVIDRLERQVTTVAALLEEQTVDFDTLVVVGDALGDSADGLDSLGKAIGPESIQRIGDGLAATADFLETKLAPGAEATADQIEAATSTLQQNARSVQELMNSAPLDLRAVRQMREGLHAFTSTLKNAEQTTTTLKLRDSVKGIRGAIDLVDTAASLADKVFASEPARKLRDISGGLEAAADAVEQFNRKLLPDIRRSLSYTRTILEAATSSLDIALSQQEKLEPVLKDLPNQVARLSNELRRIGNGFARVLRETGRVKATADALRQGQQQINSVVTNWPQLRASLGRASGLLRASQKQIAAAIEHQADYETATRQTVDLANSLAAMLPVFKSQFGLRLNEEDRLLAEMETACSDVTDAIPGVASSAILVVTIARWGIFLGAAVPLCYALVQLSKLLSSTQRRMQPC